MPDATSHCSVGEAVTLYLSNTSKAKAGADAYQVLQKFLRWYGKERQLNGLSPWEVEHFGQNSGVNSLVKLAPVRHFLNYVHKQGLTPVNLGPHLKVKRPPGRQRLPERAGSNQPSARLSQEGLDLKVAELESLKSQRSGVAEEIRKAMADKDFRENAPLDAARDRQAHLEARISDLEGTLRFAEVVEGASGDGLRSRLGSKVIVQDMEVGQEITYVLVDPTEMDLRSGKISVESPAGKAFLDRAPGDAVEVQAPVGLIHYRIERVES